jgi:hypothetical protein
MTMPTLYANPHAPTKQEEIDRFEDIIGSLPEDSYLYGILREIQKDVEDSIRNDIVVIRLSRLWDQQVEEQQKLKTLTDERRQLETLVYDLKREADRARKMLQDMATDAAFIERMARKWND